MLLRWTLFGLVCLFSVVSAHWDRHRHDDFDDVVEDTRDFARRMGHLRTDKRDEHVGELKRWVERVFHVRFTFVGTNLTKMMKEMERFMAASPVKMHTSMHSLLSNLSRCIKPSDTKFKEFINNLKNELKKKDKPMPAITAPKKSFIAISGSFTHREAESECQRRGGQLATISNAAEYHNARKSIRSGQYFVAGRSDSPTALMSPPFLSWEMLKSSGRYCGALNILTFRIVFCHSRNGALCEMFDLKSPLKQIGVKGFVYYYKNQMTHNNAEKKCASIGGSLAIITNNAEQNEAHSHLVKKANVNAFIGAKAGADRVWKWHDGSRMTFNRWGHYSMTARDTCAVMEGNIRFSKHPPAWRAVPCYREQGVMCQVRVIPDNYIRLTDRYATGKYFVMHSERVTHEIARNRCKSRLATIRDDEQLAAAMLAAKGMMVHIGLNDRITAGTFKWEDGSPLSAEIERRIKGFGARPGADRCVVLDRHSRLLIVSCEMKASILCEVPYRKDPNKPESFPHDFEIDVRFDVSYDEVTRTRPNKENFIKGVEKAVSSAIGKSADHAVVSNLRRGSTITTLGVWNDGRPSEGINKIKRAVSSGALIVYFNGRVIRPTSRQSYNEKHNIIVDCWPSPRHAKFYVFIVVGLIIAVLIVTGCVCLGLCLKKRKITTAVRVGSTITIQVPVETKKPPVPDEVLPAYEDAVAPPPYFAPYPTPPPPYASTPDIRQNQTLPDVKS